MARKELWHIEEHSAFISLLHPFKVFLPRVVCVVVEVMSEMRRVEKTAQLYQCTIITWATLQARVGIFCNVGFQAAITNVANPSIKPRNTHAAQKHCYADNGDAATDR